MNGLKVPRSGYFVGMLAAFVLAGGCGRSDLPKRAKVTGKVLYNGNPLEGAVVSFMPTDKKVRPAQGTTNAEGVFSLTTYNTNDGAIPGEYKVGVAKPVPIQATEEEAANPAKFMERSQGVQVTKTKPKSPIPIKYLSSESSGLQFVVEDHDSNNFTIELVD